MLQATYTHVDAEYSVVIICMQHVYHSYDTDEVLIVLADGRIEYASLSEVTHC